MKMLFSEIMADETTTTTKFRRNHLVRLCGFNHAALDGKLARVDSSKNEANGKHAVVLLDDRARPPVPLVPLRWMPINPGHMRHAREYCLVVAAEEVKLQMCGRCKTARYCNAECQHADWERHKYPDCLNFCSTRGSDSPLQWACKGGNVVEVRRLVEEEGADVDKATSSGPTPIATAANGGHLAVVRYLVARGADVDKARATSTTPLHGAARHGFLDVVRYLVEQGADVDKAAFEGQVPLLVAAEAGYLPVVQYLVEQGADKDNATNGQGSTPLLAAAASGHLAVVQYLMQQGADKNKADNNGVNPLRAAWLNGHAEVAAYLHAPGAR